MNKKWFILLLKYIRYHFHIHDEKATYVNPLSTHESIRQVHAYLLSSLYVPKFITPPLL